jgi:hypothetical protein
MVELSDLSLQHSRSLAVDPSPVLIKEPVTFELAVNYRSHGGIVNCARSVIELITHFWPNAIDILPEEQGVIDGIKPLFFRGLERYEQFLSGERYFGISPHQTVFLRSPQGKLHRIRGTAVYVSLTSQVYCFNTCRPGILVRDEAAKAKLQAQVGDIGLIL